MNSTLLAIKERLGIEDVVSSYIKMERAGANFKARCPFHNEKTPSFFVSPDRDSYYCFGCGAKGDIFTFVEEFEGLDFKGALKLLADKAGVPLDIYSNKNEIPKSEKDKLYEAMEQATKFFESKIHSNKDALQYLINRGLDLNTIKNFRLGYAENEWHLLSEHLNQLNFNEEEIEKAGLLKKGEPKEIGGRVPIYDRFRGRIMFPLADSSGRVIAFSGRLFPEDDKSAKYLNSPETSIFKKSAVLYGLDKAKLSIKKHNFAILVEGQMDLLLSHQAGFQNTVATSGTAFSDELERGNVVSNLGLLRRLSSNLLIAFDGDAAGVKACLRASKIAMSLGMDVKIASLPQGQDPADVISKQGKDAWRNIVRNSVSVIEFVLQKILETTSTSDRKIGLLIKEEVLPFVAILSSQIDQEFFLKKISGKTGIPEGTLKSDLQQAAVQSQSDKKIIESIEQQKKDLAKKDYILRRLIGITFAQKDLDKKNKILADILKSSNLTEDLIKKNYEDIREDLIYEAEVFYAGGVDMTRDIEELLKNLKEETLKEELARKVQELYSAEESGDDMKIKEILIQCQKLSRLIEEIKNSRSV